MRMCACLSQPNEMLSTGRNCTHLTRLLCLTFLKCAKSLEQKKQEKKRKDSSQNKGDNCYRTAKRAYYFTRWTELISQTKRAKNSSMGKGMGKMREDWSEIENTANRKHSRLFCGLVVYYVYSQFLAAWKPNEFNTKMKHNVSQQSNVLVSVSIDTEITKTTTTTTHWYA